MGEEYGETAPFYYFISHSEPELIEMVRKDKKEEFKHFEGRGEYQDPQGEETFNKCKLNWQLKQQGNNKTLWQWHQKLIEMRRTIPALKKLDKNSLEVWSLEEEKIIFLRRWAENSQIFAIMNFNHNQSNFTAQLPTGQWQKILDSSDEKWMGAGATLPQTIETGKQLNINPQSFVVYQLS